MKKIWSEEGARLLTRIRQREGAKAKLRSDDDSELNRRELQSRSAEPPEGKVELTAPENFSLITNTEEMLQFFSDIEAVLRDHRIPFLNMRKIQSITPDAIIALAASIESWAHHYRIGLEGNEPTAEGLGDILQRSGFYGHVRSNRSHTAADSGRIRKMWKRRVDSGLAEELVQFATVRVFGVPRAHWAIFGTLLECMGNTFDHAHKTVVESIGGHRSSTTRTFRRRISRFWTTASVSSAAGNCGPSRSCVRCSVFLNNRASLKRSFRGSSAREPASPIAVVACRTFIERFSGVGSSVVLITNRVRADLTRGTFSALSREFPGTLYHWELF